MDQSYQEQQQQVAPYTEFFSWGSDSYGQLALANSDEDNQYNRQRQAFYDQPKSLSFDIIISSISCGDYHAAFISGDGFVFSVGRNTQGQLGVGDSSLQLSSAPLLVDALPKSSPSPKIICCGGNHTAVIMDNGELYTWGEGSFGALGQTSIQNLFSPVQVQSREKYVQYVSVDCGKRNMAVIDSQGRLFVCGDNQSRQLGIGNPDQINTLTLVADFSEKAKSVAIGLQHTLILTHDSKVYACGNNSAGNLGLGHTYSSDNFLQVHGLLGQQIKQVAAGRHSAAITSEGRLYVWGPVFKGESHLLLPQELRSSKLMNKIAIGEKDSVVIDQDNQLYTWGLSNLQSHNPNAMPTLVESLGAKVITQIACGLEFFIALGQDFNEYGEPIGPKFQEISKTLPIEEPARQDYQSQYSRRLQDEKDYSPYQPSSKETQRQTQKEQLNKSAEYTMRPPVHQMASDSKYQESSAKRDNSMISSHSNRDPTFQYSHIQHKESDYSISTHHNLPLDKLQIQQPMNSTSGNLKSDSGRVTNADLYRQLDQVREENFSLNKKNRELMQKVNQLKQDNESIINNADSEIKRMSEFIDQYTQEVEATKKELEDDLNAKLMKERLLNDELKQKLHHTQNEIEGKLDNLQREVERLRRDNMQLTQEKTDYLAKNRQLQDQLDNAQQRISQMSQQRDYQTISPISTSKQTERLDQQRQGSYSRTPNNLHSNQLHARNEGQARTQEFQAKEQQYNQQISSAAATREVSTPLINAQRRRQPADFSPLQAYDQQSSNLEYQRSYPREAELQYSEYKQERQSPQRTMHGIKSPIRESVAYENLQPTDYRGREYESREFQRVTSNRTIDDTPAYHNVRQHQPSKSPNRGVGNDPYEIHSKIQQHQLQNTSSTNYSPSVYRREEQSSLIKSVGDKESPALNDVKNRLAVMQKNKEELEQKLKNYEAKIRQHFNR